MPILIVSKILKLRKFLIYDLSHNGLRKYKLDLYMINTDIILSELPSGLPESGGLFNGMK
ncbi:hypothetical protein [Chryseobacterium sp. SIMBA_029]|uniref:hypothetical protein n=1 Tax=Chryseobacterium sp. SIMBA_029 TaxID=3085772 RepID=UPI00397ACE79